ncbi:cytochrome b/b6 domain-containing protein [Shewanella donghaensis]|uniref:cytochrome b/b6 domain-containing protein n=1 Tax=Shewanella donghaensis TaxID=238836 RepID=UPI001182781D|nr:cytochrome b/b6 domain-containing protein [Shewanella donghaensis]
MEKDTRLSNIHRFIHWGLALSMLVMLTTILLRLGWMEKRHMAEIIQQGLFKIDLLITDKNAIVIAKNIRNVMFQWHLYFGYSVAVFVLLRFIYMAKYGLQYPSAFDAKANIRQKFQAWVYWLFYLGITLSVVTGLLIEFGPAAIEHQMETVHKLALWYFIPFISLHLAGIILAEFGHDKGVVSRIISG